MTENETNDTWQTMMESEVGDLKQDIASIREVLDTMIEGFQALKRLVDFDSKQAGGP